MRYELVLLNKGDEEIHILRSMEKYVRKVHPNQSTLEITDTGNKLSSQFDIKDKLNFEHQHDLIYHANCPIPTCEENYIIETTHHLHEPMKDHNGRYHKSHILKNTFEKYDYNVAPENFKIIAKKFKLH